MRSAKRPNDYVFLEQLGHGSYSSVFRAQERGNGARNFAIKVCSKKHIISEKKVKYVTIEKDTLNLVARERHPGVVRLFCTFHDAEKLYFVLEYVSGGELLGLIHKTGPLPELWAKHLMVQLVDTVGFLHKHGVIHRDLKPENVLLSQEGRVVITDFGAAYRVGQGTGEDESQRAASFVGTAEYVSPELLLHSRCGFASDVWALGCILYQLLQGVAPFRGDSELQTFEKIAALDYKWHVVAPVSPRDLVTTILVLNPAKRPGINRIKGHQWFSNVNWADKQAIWRGIWQLPAPSRPVNQLGDVDRSMNKITNGRRKPAKIGTTSSIVEWRKRLGLSSPIQPIIPQPLGSSAGNMPMTPPPSAKVTPVPQPPKHAAPPTSPPVAILKRDVVCVLELPYSPDTQPISMNGFSAVETGKIVNFIANHESEVVARSSKCILSLHQNGVLYCRKQGQPSRALVSVYDRDLSMYDLEFDENRGTGFLILEKFKSKLWFLSVSRDTREPSAHSINQKRSWVDSLITARKLRKPPVVDLAKKKTAKTNGPVQVVMSSSRFEVLHTLNGMKDGDASLGASAAFKNRHR
ncbi:LAMI_0H02938g1_1 [Lachancea mirantina]|uniref:non-specific serine/threonine protein kinase n=1 Tax=Lachancea mirantina TaxID=1230905 RepID=A0A1G4KE48_9SACH|nr:LAMI_0H02938g1_1 [Lachancea mirantina]